MKQIILLLLSVVLLWGQPLGAEEKDPLDAIIVVDDEPTDPRGQQYLEEQKKLEARIRADRRVRRKQQFELPIRAVKRATVEGFAEEIRRDGARTESLKTRDMQLLSERLEVRERGEDARAPWKPPKLREYVRLESDDILRNLPRQGYRLDPFEVRRTVNQSGSLVRSSSNSLIRPLIESEATIIMEQVFRSGTHETRVHPGAEQRRP